jgi:hypothetical protein
VDEDPGPVLHWCHVFDHRGDARAHGSHVQRRHAVLLLRLTFVRTSPDASSASSNHPETPMATSHTAHRRIHLDLFLVQGSVCPRMRSLHAPSRTPQTTTTQEQDHDDHHHRRHPRRQPLHP